MEVDVEIWRALLTIHLFELLEMLSRPHSFVCTHLDILVELLYFRITNFKGSLRNVSHDDPSTWLKIASTDRGRLVILPFASLALTFSASFGSAASFASAPRRFNVYVKLLELLKLLMDSHELKIFSIYPAKLLEFSKVNMVCVDFLSDCAMARWFLSSNGAEIALFPGG